MRRLEDYSLFKLGALNQATYEITIEACRRFGAAKADNVLMTAIYSNRTDSKPALIKESMEECAVTITDDDFLFLSNVATASDLINQARTILEACHGK